MIDLDDLEAKARAATPGPWFVGRIANGDREVHYGNQERADESYRLTSIEGMCRDDECRSDADFIAAANPATVLELVAEVRRLENRLRQVREQRDAWQKIARSQPIQLEPAKEPEPDGD